MLVWPVGAHIERVATMSEPFTTQQQAFLGDQTPYPLEAFEFVRDGLEETAKAVHAQTWGSMELDRHINGSELCIGLRDLAIRRWGSLARTVLTCWSIRSTSDFGRLVFYLIDAGIFAKTADDSIADFSNVFDFDEAFHVGDLQTQAWPDAAQRT